MSLNRILYLSNIPSNLYTIIFRLLIYLKLHFKGEPYRFSGYQAISVQIRYFNINIYFTNK